MVSQMYGVKQHDHETGDCKTFNNISQTYGVKQHHHEAGGGKTFNNISEINDRL